MLRLIALALLATLTACAAFDRRSTAPPPPAAQSPAGLEAALAAGGRRLTAGEARTALLGHECSGEGADGLFEITFKSPKVAVLTPPDGLPGDIEWNVREDGQLCSGLLTRSRCETILAIGDTLRLYDQAGVYRASLVCS